MAKTILLFNLFCLLITQSRAFAGIDDDLASPVNTPARIPFAIGTVATIALLATEDSTVDPAQVEAQEHRLIGRSSKLGDYGGRMITNAAYTLGMLTAGAFGDRSAFTHARVMFLATLYSAAVTTALKYTVREPRPNDGTDKKSFPSGHSTTAFAFASVVGAEHGFFYGFLAYALAGVVAYSRMTDDKHRLHDVVAGATIGTGYGLGIHYRHGKRSRQVSVLPYFEKNSFGLAARVNF